MPVLNEADALRQFLPKLAAIAHRSDLRIVDVIFVDDGSTDGTREVIEGMADLFAPVAVRILRRGAPGGSASAELYGCQHAHGEYVAKLDGDGQHDPARIPDLIHQSREGYDVVIASRYCAGGASQWPALRGLVSRSARFLAHVILPPARRVTDPISGYFLVRKSLADGLDPTRARYKLLLYLLAANATVYVQEVPFVMGDRSDGVSKIAGSDLRFTLNFLIELLYYYRVYHRRRMALDGRNPSSTLADEASPGPNQPRITRTENETPRRVE
ncbi:MAG: glycosyltransferase [Thermoplasmata archaeon]